jgi:hypothetical protein
MFAKRGKMAEMRIEDFTGQADVIVMAVDRYIKGSAGEETLTIITEGGEAAKLLPTAAAPAKTQAAPGFAGIAGFLMLLTVRRMMKK